MKTVANISKTIKDIINNNNNNNRIKSDAGTYSIQCLGYNRTYKDVTLGSINKLLYEFTRELKVRYEKIIEKHNSDTNENVQWKDVKILVNVHHKLNNEIGESCLISDYHIIQQKLSFLTLYCNSSK